MSRRRICVFTGTRAEYGLLRWVMEDLRTDQSVELQVLVTGSHLSPHFGETWRQIAADGFAISARVDMLVDGDSAQATAASIGLAVMKYADTLAALRPDILVLLGDRYEALAAATAATCLGIPIAHLHGGESSEGAIDEAFRHAITVMAHLHFPAAESYRRRVIQLGVQPDRVFLAGSPALDNLARLTLLDRAALAADLGFDLDGRVFMVTYHPVTLGETDPVNEIRELCAALDHFPDARIVVSRANQDAGARAINAHLEQWAAAAKGRVHLVSSLGTPRYLSLVTTADAVIGNSSSGIIEVPAAGTATVNVGSRQDGRLRAPAVIDCPCVAEAIAAAITRALTPEHQALARQRQTPYGKPGASTLVARTLATVPLSGLLRKPFHDLPEGATP
ncbi:MAG: UDP-N-acetylglucosamine 2-epimerase (hydrolyzing) [Alphaproteobacteria bacterium]|nr:UDP-N-acetylglucosamine 2-epimerase (hydrolyzing) [Alphaproteobacteria bacterium]